ncbi:sensor histidine kinase [Dactylosporangium cerinum]|uniref:histidine kinase n=1 Tax=Dactylosporangium cerinum TaxID=1434730 RepID=A0ABV9WDC1_9ACTN
MHRLMSWPRRYARVVEPALAVVLAVPALVNPQAGGPLWAQGGVLAGLVLPLLWRRSQPEAMTAVVLAAAWLGLLTRTWSQHLPLAHAALQLMLHTLVVRGRRRPAALAALAAAAFFVSWSLTRYPASDAGWAAVTYCLSIATAWLLGEYVRARRAYLQSVERRAELADSERRALARAAAAEERARIARELHDVLAHSVGVMVVNAEGAQLMRHTDPAVVDRTLRLVSTTGRAALKELRRLLEVLHEDGTIPPPQPSLADLRQLVDGVGAGRAMAGLRLTGTEEGVPAGAVLQTYRIVQEALTNVVKHAGTGAGVDVAVDLGVPGLHRTVRIEVRDDGAGERGSGPRLPSSGRGITGMRERVAMFGGTLEAAPAPEGGFRVSATLPLDGEPCLTGPPQEITAAPQEITAPPQATLSTMGPCTTDHRSGS